MFALYEGVEKLIDPHELESPVWAFGVLGVAMVLEGLSLRTAHREADPSRQGRSWWRFIRTTKSPELPVVLLEDTGALVGLLFALIGISLAEITGNPRWDALGSIGIGLLLGVIAVILAVEMKSLLIGESVAPAVDARIRERDPRRPRGRSGSSTCARCTSAPTTCCSRPSSSSRATDIPSLAHAIDTVEARVRASSPIVHLIYFEPDLYDVTRANQEEPPMTDSSDATVAAVDRFNDAFNRHDVDAVMAAMTDDCVFESTSPPSGQRYEGQDQVRGGMGGVLRRVAHRALRRRGRHRDRRPLHRAVALHVDQRRRIDQRAPRRRRAACPRRQGGGEVRVREGLTATPRQSMRRSSFR